MGRTGDSLVHEFPPRSGGGGAHRVNTVDGPKRGGPWIRWINNYCWARWTTYPPSRLDSVDISTTFIENPPARTSGPGGSLLLLCPLFRDSRLRILMNLLQNVMDFHRFYKNCHFHTRIFITFRRWVVLASRWVHRPYKNMSFAYKDLRSFSKMSRVSIRMTAVNFL